MLDFGFYNADCMDGMKMFPDGYFELAIVDPPYGDALNAEQSDGSTYPQRFGGAGSRFERYKREPAVERTGRQWAAKYGKKIIEWDVAPGEEYFKELFRVSRNQIIWGGNYFNLPPTRCFVVWRKINIPLKGFTMAPAEYAWTSFNRNAVVLEASSVGTKADPRFHPTSKPIKLYEELLERFANKGDKILDTHVGSGSSLIACERMGFKCVGFEIDKVYYDLAKARIAEQTAQVRMEL